MRGSQQRRVAMPFHMFGRSRATPARTPSPTHPRSPAAHAARAAVVWPTQPVSATPQAVTTAVDYMLTTASPVKLLNRAFEELPSGESGCKIVANSRSALPCKTSSQMEDLHVNIANRKMLLPCTIAMGVRPAASELAAFWTSVVRHKITRVFIVSTPDENPRLASMFGDRSGETQTFPGNVRTRTANITRRGAIRRVSLVVTAGTTSDWSCTCVIYDDWPSGSIPAAPHDALTLVHEVIVHPAVVVCADGARASALVLAAVVIDKARYGVNVTVLDAVRRLRDFRARAVPEVKQVLFSLAALGAYATRRALSLSHPATNTYDEILGVLGHIRYEMDGGLGAAAEVAADEAAAVVEEKEKKADNETLPAADDNKEHIKISPRQIVVSRFGVSATNHIKIINEGERCVQWKASSMNRHARIHPSDGRISAKEEMMIIIDLERFECDATDWDHASITIDCIELEDEKLRNDEWWEDERADQHTLLISEHKVTNDTKLV